MNTSHGSFVALVRDRALTQADTAVHVYPDEPGGAVTFTYAVLDAEARRVAALLARVGATAGARAVLLYPPGPAFAAAFFGCLYAGVIAVPLPLPTRPAEIARLTAVAASASPALILTTTGLIATVTRVAAGALGGAPVVATDAAPPTYDVAGEVAVAAPDPDDVAFLQYTSGSTGAPRGVMVTHRNLVANSSMIARAFDVRPGTVGVGWLPHFHDMGLIGNLLQPIHSAFPMVLVSPATLLRNPIGWLQRISQHRATLSGGPNFAYELCVRRLEQRGAPDDLDLSSWDLAFCGAEPVRPATLERFAAAFARHGFRREAFYPCYGLAEATLLVTGGSKPTAPPVIRRGAQRLVGNGWAQGDSAIRIVDPATGAAVAAGGEGEIWVRGDHVARGYWAHDPAEDARTFRAEITGEPGPTYLRTGDLGAILDGELVVTGRLKDLIIVRGQNHYPQDIEASVEQAHRAVRPGCVAAFALDADGDERVAVVAEIRPSEPSLLDVAAAIRARVASDWDVRLHTIALVPPSSLHKTSSGKVQRSSTRAALLAGRLAVIDTSRPEATP